MRALRGASSAALMQVLANSYGATGAASRAASSSTPAVASSTALLSQRLRPVPLLAQPAKWTSDAWRPAAASAAAAAPQRRGPPPAAAYSAEPAAWGGSANSDFIGETDWSPEIANSVQLVGNLGADPEVRYLESGNMVGRMRLAVKRGKEGETTDWFDVEVWGPLAERSAQQLRKGVRIAVGGRLRIEDWTARDGSRRTTVKVVASTINMVRRMQPLCGAFGTVQPAAVPPPLPGMPPSPLAPTAQPPQMQATAEQLQVDPSTMAAGWEPRQQADASNPADAKWLAYFDSPGSYWDNRIGKRNPKAPDFKHKENNEALWISSYDTPAWVAEQLARQSSIPSASGWDDEDIPF